MPYMCPYFDAERKKCTLWDTYQSDYAIKEYCMGSYSDSYRKCPNFESKKRDGVVW